MDNSSVHTLSCIPLTDGKVLTCHWNGAINNSIAAHTAVTLAGLSPMITTCFSSSRWAMILTTLSADRKRSTTPQAQRSECRFGSCTSCNRNCISTVDA